MRAEQYRRVFRNRSFRRFWLGFAFSSLGDAMTRVALTWYVFSVTESSRALGLLVLCYTGPILIGGLVAGSLLDRFDRRRVMAADSVVRGLAVFSIPLLHALGRLELWQVYAVAAIYGLLMMISLAGGPAIVPSLVAHEDLVTVNALELLGFTVGGIIGPPAAGLLLARVGAPNVLLVDAASYALFALALAGVRYRPEHTPRARPGGETYRLADAFRVMLGNPILRATTLMFMAFNVGNGLLAVWLPIFSARTLHGGAGLYGALLGAIAVGELASSLAAGSMTFPLPLGTLICLSQVLTGASVLLLLTGHVGPALAGLAGFGLFEAPLTIWAQTLRMAIIPERLRGRTFALLRMLMQGGGPLGGAAGAVLVPALGMGTLVALTAGIMGTPGIAGLRVRALRSGDRSGSAADNPRPAPQTVD